MVDPDTDVPCRRTAGELQFRGECVTRGYYPKPAETAAAFTPDGWFRTGDLAVQDAAGPTFFKGRGVVRETLRISHHMVAPGESEAFLMSHPAVEQAFVVSVPDPATDEAPVASVILRPGARLAEDELRAFCRGRIASFKSRGPSASWTMSRTPGPHGDKVQKGKLRDRPWASWESSGRDGGVPRGLPRPAGQRRPHARRGRGGGADGGGERRHRHHGMPGDRTPERRERGLDAPGTGGGGAPRAADRPGPARRRRVRRRDRGAPGFG